MNHPWAKHTAAGRTEERLREHTSIAYMDEQGP